MPDELPGRGNRKLWCLLCFYFILLIFHFWSVFYTQFSSVAQSCPTLCDPLDCSTPGFPILHQLLELAQIHVHRVGNAIQASHPLSSPSPPALNLSQHQPARGASPTMPSLDLPHWVSLNPAWAPSLGLLQHPGCPANPQGDRPVPSLSLLPLKCILSGRIASFSHYST